MKKEFVLLHCLLFCVLFSTYIFAEKAKVKWVNSITGSSNENVGRICTDKEGNILITGSSTSYELKLGTKTLINEYYFSFFLAKYSTSGSLMWANNSGSESQSGAIGLTVDPTGNSFISGSFKSSELKIGTYSLTNSMGGTYGKMYVAKYNSNGQVLWAKTPTNTDLSSGMYGLATDKAGNLFTTGHFQDNSFTFGNITVTNTAAPNQDIFLVKFDPTGKALWGKNIGGNNHDVGKTLTTDNAGNVIVGGTFKSSSFLLGGKTITNAGSGETDIIIAKYDTNGILLWSKNFGGTSEDMVNSVCTDSTGNIYVCGYTRNTSLKFDSFTLPNLYSLLNQCYLVKLSASGNVLWVRTVDSINNNINTYDGYSEVFNSVSCDVDGNVVVTGTTGNTIISFNKITLNSISNYGNNIIILKFNSDGQAIWGKIFGNNADESGVSCASDINKNYYVSGQYKSAKVDFDSISVANNYTSLSTTDVFLSKLITIPDTIHISYCIDNNRVKLSAPINYSKYEWYDASNILLGGDSILFVNNPIVGSKYYCKITVGKDNMITLSAEIKNFELNAEFSFNITDCKLNRVSFTNLSSTNVIPLTYNWRFSDGTSSTEKNPVHVFPNSGKYKVTLSVSNALSLCPDTVYKTVEVYSPMNVIITGDSLCCEGYTTTLKATGAESYIWSDGNQTDSIVANETSGKIWVIGNYGNSVCSSEKIYKTIKKGNPTLNISGYRTYCPGKSTVIKVNGAKYYNWNTGESTDSIHISAPGGKYWVVGTSAGGCISDTLFFNITEESEWDFSISGQKEFCKNDSTTILAIGGEVYLWNTGSKNESIVIKQSGSYSVKALNLRGCEKELNFIVNENDLPLSDFEVSPSEINNKLNAIICKIQPEENTEYEWNFGDGTIANGSVATHSYFVDNSTREFVVSLIVKNQKGCTNSSKKSIDVVPYVPNVFTPNNDGINDLFLPNLEILIIDRMGIEIYNGKNGWDGNYHAQPVPSDTYFYYLRYLDKNDHVQTKKGYITLIR